jgi:uncharacterized protein (DUF1015 family)
MLAIGAQTGPVFLIYNARADVNAIAARAAAADPLFDFDAPDGVRHTVWRASAADRDALVAAFGRIPALYIADGHHRAASAARARTELDKAASARPGAGPGDADYHTMLAVAFPHDQVQILAYNRAVKDLAGLSSAGFLAAVGRAFDVSAGPAMPARAGDIAMYLDGAWKTLRAREAPAPGDVIAALDVSVLQDRLLAPILKIADVRTDTRIDFVGGARGTAALERMVDEGRAAVAFSMYPVRVSDLMAVSDAGGIMPPKSTWFEPKLRDGLLSHVI